MGKYRYTETCPLHPEKRAPLRQCKICKALYQRRLKSRSKLLYRSTEPYGVIQLNWPVPEL